MFIEFLPGEKYAKNNADIADSPDCFKDAGYVLEKDDLVVDVDCLSQDIIRKLIETFNIKTQIVWTDKGAHFYFKKPTPFKGANRVCALGFPIEFKHEKNTKAITVKRNGVLREVINGGVREDLPPIFSLNKKFDNLFGHDDGDGRNNALFSHRGKLAGVNGWGAILDFINCYMFADPLPEREFAQITRELKVKAEKDNEADMAEYIMHEFKMVKYSGSVYFRYEGEYTNDEELLKRLVYKIVGNQKTRYIDEIIKQINYRCKIFNDTRDFFIKFKNGILRTGEFIEVDYDEFTPYSIDIPYQEDAEPVECVDQYIDHLTGGDEDYKKLLFEVLGHTLIVDKEFKRVLRKFFIFIGGGGNGKGTLLQVIKQILNPKNCSALSIRNMSDERYFVTMKGKLANLGDDIQDEPINNEQIKHLKNISSCDGVEARELYKQSASVQLTLTLIFTSNHVLKSFEKGASYKSRVLWLPMFTEVKEENKDALFISKLTSPKALEYWIRLILDGYFRLYKNHGFSSCKVVRDYNEEYHKDNNNVMSFLEDYTAEFIEGKRSPLVMEEYELWADDNGLNKASVKMLKEAIWNKFKLAIGTKKINGKSAKVFMTEEETKQKIV